MGKRYIRKDDAKRVNAFVALTSGFVTVRDGYWEVTSPDGTLYFESVPDMMECIDEELELLRSVVDPDIFQKALDNDGKLKVR